MMIDKYVKNVFNTNTKEFLPSMKMPHKIVQ